MSVEREQALAAAIAYIDNDVARFKSFVTELAQQLDQAHQQAHGMHSQPAPEAPKLPDPMVMEPETYGQCVFTRNEADGALANGTIVRKVAEEVPNEGTPLGTMGRVIGSLPAELDKMPAKERIHLHDLVRTSEFFYFVEWRTTPDVVIGMASNKIEEV